MKKKKRKRKARKEKKEKSLLHLKTEGQVPFRHHHCNGSG
jgi:hypothetical protein